MAKRKEPAIAVDNQEVAAAVNEATAPVNAVIEQEFEAEVDISSLQPHPSNPNEGDEKAILSSITDIGFYGAVIAQKSTRTILVGEHRWKAAKAKKAKTIPVVWVNCNDLEAVRILLADNRTADLARYKEAEKRALLKSCVDRYGGQFLNGTGFTRLDIKMPKSALDSITRPAVKEAVKGNNAHHKPKTTVKFSVGRVKYLVDNDDFRKWLDQIEQEAKETSRTIEEIAAERMGVELLK